ncbi:MAG: hypothetical protein H0W33_03605 [Gammaproteobacteria bacterium]|nr:hypothetical protein [Gammaproteobacteria bacterium]
MRVLLLVLLACVTSGCYWAERHERRAEGIRAAQEFQRTVPVCITDDECDRKWAFARRWVLDNSGYKIQHYSDDYIETFNIRDIAATRLWVRVTREPAEYDDSYRILVELGCNNPLGCNMELPEARQRFNDYVNSH